MSPLTEDRIRSLLCKYSIRPDKNLGQSFLINTNVARDIVKSAGVAAESKVLEIGGGFGILSEQLAQKADKVFIIEIDSRLVQALREVLVDYSNVEVIHGDALTVTLPEVDRIVSNLPYSISSPITFRVLEEAVFDSAVLMYQEEFAERLLASPGMSNYSRLSVDIQYLAVIEELMRVPATEFYPTPSVDSKVVRISHRREGVFARDKETFFWVVHGIYSYPNKVLRKALGIWLKNMEQDKSLVDDIIRRSAGVLNGGERLRSLDQEKLVVIADGVFDLIEEGVLPGPRGSSN